MTHVPLQAIVVAYLLGSSLLAAWTLVRFSRRLPAPRLPGTLVVCAAAAAACDVVGRAAPAAVTTVGPAATLLALLLPALFFAFWSAGRLVQAFAGGLFSR